MATGYWLGPGNTNQPVGGWVLGGVLPLPPTTQYLHPVVHPPAPHRPHARTAVVIARTRELASTKEILGVDNALQNTRYWILDTGYWILVDGAWLLVDGAWLLVDGAWSLEPGAWSLDQPGAWINLEPGSTWSLLQGPTAGTMRSCAAMPCSGGIVPCGSGDRPRTRMVHFW